MPNRVAFIPYDTVNRSNAYAFRMRAILSRFGTVGPFEGTKSFALRLVALRWWRYDATVVNWVDNEMLDPQTRRVALGRVAKLMAKAAIMRLASRRLVFVRHNNYPHGTAAGEEANARRWVDRYERLYTDVLTHSGAAAVPPRRYAPHPLYAVVGVDARPPVDPAWPADYFVLFGMMFPYKRIEELIDRFPAHRNLIVVGAVGDADYAARLQSKARSNVIVQPGFLEEAEAQAYVARSMGLLVTHADADVVVSGSFFYAMGLRTRVIAVTTPFLEWVAPLVGPALLRIAKDLDDLCAIVGSSEPGTHVPVGDDRVEDLFGDDAVRRAWAPIFASREGAR